jgi:hypothetical protein
MWKCNGSEEEAIGVQLKRDEQQAAAEMMFLVCQRGSPERKGPHGQPFWWERGEGDVKRFHLDIPRRACSLTRASEESTRTSDVTTIPSMMNLNG